jgi:hypothetical protein
MLYTTVTVEEPMQPGAVASALTVTTPVVYSANDTLPVV